MRVVFFSAGMALGAVLMFVVAVIDRAWLDVCVTTVAKSDFSRIGER